MFYPLSHLLSLFANIPSPPAGYKTQWDLSSQDHIQSYIYNSSNLDNGEAPQTPRDKSYRDVHSSVANFLSGFIHIPFQSTNQSIARHSGRLFKLLLLEHRVLMIDIYSKYDIIVWYCFWVSSLRHLTSFTHSDIERPGSEYTAGEAILW